MDPSPQGDESLRHLKLGLNLMNDEPWRGHTALWVGTTELLLFPTGIHGSMGDKEPGVPMPS